MNGAERIAQERTRQVEEEGWTAEHDETEHEPGDLAAAAAVYAAGDNIYEENRPERPSGFEAIEFDPLWPFDAAWFKPSGYERNVDALCHDDRLNGRIRDLEKAGALCAAEIDRLLRILGDRHEA